MIFLQNSVVLLLWLWFPMTEILQTSSSTCSSPGLFVTILYYWQTNKAHISVCYLHEVKMVKVFLWPIIKCRKKSLSINCKHLQFIAAFEKSIRSKETFLSESYLNTTFIFKYVNKYCVVKNKKNCVIKLKIIELDSSQTF